MLKEFMCTMHRVKQCMTVVAENNYHAVAFHQHVPSVRISVLLCLKLRTFILACLAGMWQIFFIEISTSFVPHH
jgi:hypothetical protein